MKKSKPVAKAAKAAKTNPTKGSLVKVVVLEDLGKWIKPEKGSIHYIDGDAKFPEITFEIETSHAGPCEWKWHIRWDAKVSGLKESSKRSKLLKTFEEKGKISGGAKSCNMACNGKAIGGALTVEVKAGEELFKRTVYIKGKNPSESQLKQFVATLDGAQGFEKILLHEALGKNFINADGEPVVAFDKGYGLTQMTNPAPTYEQVWNWKENVRAGMTLYKQKRAEAKKYLEKKGKTSYTEAQLQAETYSRYNGGNYHEWSETEKNWKRKSNLLCDDETGNIGWDTAEKVNKDKTEAELHKRDQDKYGQGKAGQTKEHKWMYTGICYADHVKNK